MSRLQPLTVTARLEAGIVFGHPWGIALDGLLASILLDQGGGDEMKVLDQATPSVLELPLTRCDAGRSWHWAATCAWPVDGRDLLPHVNYYSAHADHRHLEALAETTPKTVSDRRGRFRAHYRPLLVTTCTAVVWQAVGDVDEILNLLAQVPAIGKKRTHGHGRVHEWTVTPTPTLASWDASHLHPDGTLGRPCPPSCLDGRAEVVDGGRGRAGVRPPYIHPATQADVRLPAPLGA